VDLEADAANCGACGATCAGTCTSGRCLVTLAKDSYGPGPLAQDSSNLYWGDGNCVANTDQIPKSGGAVVVVGSACFADLVAVDASNVYWQNGNDALVAAPIGGGPLTTLIASNPDATSILSDGTNVYFADAAFPARIASVPVAGGPITTIEGSQYDPRALLLSNGELYWADSVTGIQRIAKGGWGYGVLFGNSVDVLSMATDGTTLYFIDQFTNDVLSMPTGGGTPIVLEQNQDHAFRIATDGVSIYWLTTNNYKGSLYKAPVGGGPSTELASGFASAWDLVVDGTSVYWTSGFEILKLTPK